MKTIGSSLLITLLISSNGCISYNTIQHAKGQSLNASGNPVSDPYGKPDAKPPPKTDPAYAGSSVSDTKGNPDSKPPRKAHPAYYALLPVTIPLDIATAPFQGIFFGYVYLVLRYGHT